MSFEYINNVETIDFVVYCTYFVVEYSRMLNEKKSVQELKGSL